MAREKTNKINIYKLCNIEFDAINIVDEGYVKQHEDATRKLFVQAQRESWPKWVEYLQDYISSGLDEIVNKSSSFILICKYGGNLYALTGGYGHNKIKEDMVGDFGLDVALRVLDEKSISALNQKAIKGNTRQIYRAVSGYDPLFDKDNYTRVLNAIEGKAKFSGKTFRIVGKSSLALRTEKDITRLDEVFQEIESILMLPEKIHFPKSYEVVRNKDLIEQLNQNMFAVVKDYFNGSGSRDRLYLEFDDPLIQFRCDKFEVIFNRRNREITEFDLDVVKTALGDEVSAIDSVEDLKRLKFSGINEDGITEFHRESFIDLLVCEIAVDGNSYIKFGRKWLKILDEIKDFLDEEIKKIEVCRGLLPDWDKSQHPKELGYNQYIAEQNGWECLDQDFVYIEGKSKIELCDVLNKEDKQFFHVKNTWGSKSAYLFNQGVTAAEFYCNSANFRQKCREKWPAIFDADFKQCEVVFGMASDRVSEDQFPANMTFFAKLNLYNAAVILKQNDYGVKLAPINII